MIVMLNYGCFAVNLCWILRLFKLLKGLILNF
jgi:hypothetical protein